MMPYRGSSRVTPLNRLLTRQSPATVGSGLNDALRMRVIEAVSEERRDAGRVQRCDDILCTSCDRQRNALFLAGTQQRTIRPAIQGRVGLVLTIRQWKADQSVNSLNPRPLKIIGTHLSARAARVFACFAPET
jgi:hypothetical protein